MGSSQLLKMNCSNVLKKLGVEHTIHHTSIDEAKSTAHDYDLIVVGENFVNSFNVKEGTKVIIANAKYPVREILSGGVPATRIGVK